MLNSCCVWSTRIIVSAFFQLGFNVVGAMLPVLFVVKDVLDVPPKTCRHKAGESPRQKSDTDCYAKCENLDSSLLLKCSALCDSWEEWLYCSLIGKSLARSSSSYSSNNASDDAWNSMQIVHTASIMQASFSLQELVEVCKTESWASACKSTNKGREACRHNHISTCSNCNTSSNSCVQNNFHLKLVVDQSWHSTCTNATCTNGHCSVDDNSLLRKWWSQRCIETWPVHVEE